MAFRIIIVLDETSDMAIRIVGDSEQDEGRGRELLKRIHGVIEALSQLSLRISPESTPESFSRQTDRVG